MNTIWINTLAWVLAIVAAVMLAVVAPNESSVMGRMPVHEVHLTAKGPLTPASDLQGERMLALVTFGRNQRPDLEAWIEGLRLRGDNRNISWMHIPVVQDPGDPVQRSRIESHLIAKYTREDGASPMSPLFTDRETFVRTAALGSTDLFHAIVVNRQGEILARAGGQFSEEKAAALLETLHSSEP